MSEYFQNFSHLIKIYIQCIIQNSQTFEQFCCLLYQTVCTASCVELTRCAQPNSRTRMHYFNKCCKPGVEYQINDLVYLLTKNLPLLKHRAQNLMPKFIGPLLDIDHWWISDKSILLYHPLLHLSVPKSIPISITSLTPLRRSLSPLSHPSSLCSLFHWYPFPCHYDPLVPHIWFSPPIPVFPCFTLVPFVPSP